VNIPYLTIVDEIGEPSLHIGIKIIPSHDTLYVIQREIHSNYDEGAKRAVVMRWDTHRSTWMLECEFGVEREDNESWEEWDQRSIRFFDFIHAIEEHPENAAELTREFDNQPEKTP